MKPLILWPDFAENGMVLSGNASVERTKYRAMARLDERHIRVMIL